MQDGGLMITRNVIKDSAKKARTVDNSRRLKILKRGVVISMV